ncbi:MAG TPA: hypothetical protein VMU56_02955, partial [Beijerinckiaceae bacterium]|nr:hypothetical protein [Beijerinckiaceae bacterium]
LTEMVTRSGHAFDVAEPVRAPEANGAGGRDPFQGRGELAAPAAPLLRPAVLPAPVPAPQPAAPEARTSQQGPARPTPGPAPARGPGWLTDLLARASRDESESPAPPSEPAKPAPQPHDQRVARGSRSLDALSRDIAGMLDEQAAVEVWDRYYQGERHAFSRKLYTLQGQETFDEIRRRYSADRDFREAVDRYAAEFERLVNEASREDRDGSLVRGYLVSESGKVYTMLAHASGRLD